MSETITSEALRYFERLAAEATRAIAQLPAGSQPLWFRQSRTPNPYRSQP